MTVTQSNGYPVQIQSNGFPPPSGSSGDDLRMYLAIAIHWAWLIVLFTVIGGGISYYTSNGQPRIYRASTTLYLSRPKAAGENVVYDYYSERLIQSYAEMIVQEPILEGVISELGLTISAGSLKSKIRVEVVPNTQLMQVTVNDTQPARARDIANTIGSVFAKYSDDFQASRYQETKNNLSAQLASTDQQIQETVSQLQAVEQTSESGLNRSLLEAKLNAYNQAYQGVLAKLLLAEGSEKKTLSTQLATLDSMIQTTMSDLNQLGGNQPKPSAELDRLQANLALYRQTYANLLQAFEQVRLAEIQNTLSIVIVEPAKLPMYPISPNVSKATLMGAVIGLLIAGGVVFLLETIDDTIKGPDEVVQELGLPVLGVIAKSKEDTQVPIARLKPRSPETEAYRLLRTHIQFASVDTPLRSLLVTSPQPKDGKSTIASNIAIVFAQGQSQVVLVDADLRKPTQHRKFNARNYNGLSNFFVDNNNGTASELIKKTTVPRLSLLSSGPLPPNPAELVGSGKMADILEQACRQSNLVILDSPPLTTVADPAILAARVDGVLLVLRPGATKIAAARQAVEQLIRGGAKLLGVVLNDVDNQQSRYYYYYRSYYAYKGYYYEEDGTRKRRKRHRKRGRKILERLSSKKPPSR